MHASTVSGSCRKMPRCLMAKKWKAYQWTADEEKPVDEEEPIKKSISDDEEDEEIDVVTIQQSCESTCKQVIQYQSSHCEENAIVEQSNAPLPNYYQASPDDYPSPNAGTGSESEAQFLNGPVPPSVIQQHTSHPTPQIRLTSVIHHSGSFLTQNNGGNLQQTNSSMHHSASPMQPQSAWGPSSPTEGATAPSPPPHIQHSSDSDLTTMHYNGYTSTADISHYAAYLPGESATVTSTSYATLQSANESQPPPARTRSLAMCFTSTGAALSLPPKKKDIYRPYSLDDRPSVRWRPAEDLSAAHAILDLSASPPAPAPPPPPPPPPPSLQQQQQHQQQQRSHSPASAQSTMNLSPKSPSSKTIAYTYEAFFVSDGRSKKKAVTSTVDNVTVISTSSSGGDQRPKYTCSECGKQYATSSNLSRHKQTHRSLDSQSAKKCMTCGKAYVSMPALAMHLLTHKLNHACGICGKLFSRPWLLQGHLRSHTGEKPYGCAHCGKAFADRSNLRAHMQTHSTDKNFECTRCHKTFALKSYLNKHLESACVGETDCNTAITNQVSTITHLR